VGALHACLLSQRGYNVDLYEARKDVRKSDTASGRSINLALSYRGIQSLKKAGLDDKIIKLGTAMHSRMIHPLNKPCYEIPYGKKEQYLLSIDRLKLNQDLLSAAEERENVKIHFSSKLVSCDLNSSSALFKTYGILFYTVEQKSKVIFGCDGAYSAVRRQMQREVFDYAQSYIPHSYKELSIPATKKGEYALPPNHLHIWPRHKLMLIALPNQNRSFTCTLFMPVEEFERIQTGDDAVQFFNQMFPDALPLIGEDFLKKDFFHLPPLRIITVKCSPYHYKNTAALLGDAAHSITPFYGQGLNAGLEDTLLFDELMEKYDCDFDTILPKYSEMRCSDGHAISELSHQNYIEVAFTRIRYHQVILQSERANKVI
uniref:FAD-binding domain-containing protein n=1 Tax=Ciona savignyi TaxID=51511 RepID=H2Z2S8_CIOSA